MKDQIIQDSKVKMDKALEAFQREIARLRTGRASLSLLEEVRVDYYGQIVPLNQVASLSIPEPRLMTVAPWEQNLIPAIEKAIEKANIGISPVTDGKVIRLPVPALTEERRKDLVKLLKQHAEENRVAIRHARRDGMDALKKLEKDGKLSEDDSKKASVQLQKLTDDSIAKIDEVLAKKEKDIMQV